MAKRRYKKKLFDPSSGEQFKISRSKIDTFLQCKRCSYLDLRLGVGRVQGPPFTLNSAVDHLLKKEFDAHRVEEKAHALMKQYGIDGVPFQHEDIEKWRHNFTGVQYLHEPTNFFVFGAIDDVWVTPKGELLVVDYKATAKNEGPKSEDDLYDSYRRQMEVYQWLLRNNGFTVSDTGYFVYANGRKDMKAFDGKLEFEVVVIPYKGDSSWVEKTLKEMKEILSKEEIPDVGKSFDGKKPCEYCTYREEAGKVLHEHIGLETKKRKQ